MYSRPFGIVQGRLTVPPEGKLQWFPKDSWHQEFETAKSIGIQFIELLTERQFNPDNPFWNKQGRSKIKSVNQHTGRLLYSSCADYIIDHSLLDDQDGETKAHVHKFLEASADLGCKIAVLPLLERSDLNTTSADQLVPLLRNFAQQAAHSNMLICIESMMSGQDLKAFLELINEPNLKCVFDTGNRVIANPELASEICLLGDWISHVHIKDKNAIGENVLLGTGLVDFLKVFTALKQIDYKGPLVFETTRGIDPKKTANFHMSLCNFFSNEADNG